MRTVGVRELKENLSRVLRDVKAGERVVITDRRKHVALLVPLGTGREEEGIHELIRRGEAEWSGGKPKGLRPRARVRGVKLSETVLEERG